VSGPRSASSSTVPAAIRCRAWAAYHSRRPLPALASRSDPVNASGPLPSIPPHPPPGHDQHGGIADEIQQIIKPATRTIDRPLVLTHRFGSYLRPRRFGPEVVRTQALFGALLGHTPARGGRRAQTVRAVELTADALAERGYRFVPVGSSSASMPPSQPQTPTAARDSAARVRPAAVRFAARGRETPERPPRRSRDIARR
jgi:hypothetical protein